MKMKREEIIREIYHTDSSYDANIYYLDKLNYQALEHMYWLYHNVSHGSAYRFKNIALCDNKFLLKRYQRKRNK